MPTAIGATYRETKWIGAAGVTFTRTSSRVNGLSSTWNPTITDLADGNYEFSFVIGAAVDYSWAATGSNGAVVTLNERGIAAAADPAALATAVAAVQTTVDGIDTLVDVAVSTRATPGAYVTTGSATATSGAVTVYQGDDQVAVASRSLDWATTTADQWPDLTGATILLSGQYRANAAHTVSAAGSVVTPTGATKAVRVELSAAETEALHDGVYEIQVIATTSGGKVVTLVDTTMTVKPRKGP